MAVVTRRALRVLVVVPALAPAVGAAAARAAPVIPLADDAGGVCVLFDRHDPRPVNCRRPGDRGFRIAHLPGSGDDVTVAGVGDVNGDGIDDVAVGVPPAAFGGRADAGVTYVVYGQRSGAAVDLRALGARGFAIGGAAAGDETAPVEAGRGDVNGDGLADLIVQSDAASTAGRSHNGAAWVVFGRRGGGDVDLAALGGGGFRLDGISRRDPLGTVGIAGDLDGDGRAEIVGSETTGVSVLRGRRRAGPIDLARAAHAIRGLGRDTGIGATFAELGDVDGDGRDDLLVAKYDTARARAYVVLGRRRLHDIDVRRAGQGILVLRGPHRDGGFGVTAAGPGRVGAGRPPGIAVSDADAVYVHTGRRVRTLAYPQRIRHEEPAPTLLTAVGGRGDLVVEPWVVARSAYRVVVVFGRTGGGRLDLRHPGRAGFVVRHTADGVPR